MKNANILPAHTSSSYCAVSSMSTSESTFSSSSSFWNTTTALIAATVAMAVVATPDYVSPNKTTDCCGIVDVIGTKDHPDVLPNQSINNTLMTAEQSQATFLPSHGVVGAPAVHQQQQHQQQQYTTLQIGGVGVNQTALISDGSTGRVNSTVTSRTAATTTAASTNNYLNHDAAAAATTAPGTTNYVNNKGAVAATTAATDMGDDASTTTTTRLNEVRVGNNNNDDDDDEFAVSDEFIAGIIAVSETAAGTVYDGDEVEVGSNNNNDDDDDEFAVSDEFIAGIIAVSETAGNTTATTGRRSSRQCRQSQNKEDDDEDEYLSTNFTTTTTKSSKRKLISSAIGDEEDDDDNEDFTKGKREASRSRYVILGESDDDDSDDDEDDGASYPDVDEDDDDDRIDDPIDADVYEETTTTDAVTSTTALNSVASTSVLTTTTMVSAFTKKNKNSNDKDAAVVYDDFVEGEDGDDEPALEDDTSNSIANTTTSSTTTSSTTTTVPCPECGNTFGLQWNMYKHFRNIHKKKCLRDGSCENHGIPILRVSTILMPKTYRQHMSQADYAIFIARLKTHVRMDMKFGRYTDEQSAFLNKDLTKNVHAYGRQLLDVVIKRGMLQPGFVDDAGGRLHKGLRLPKFSGIHQLSLDRKKNNLAHIILGESITTNLRFVALGMNTQANIVVRYGNETCDNIKEQVKAGKMATEDELNDIVNEQVMMKCTTANKCYKSCSSVVTRETKLRNKGSDNIEITNAMNKFHEQFPDNQSLYMHALKLFRKQKGKCAVSKIIMRDQFEGGKYYQVSLDAIDPKKHHVKDNLQLICCFVNCTNMDKIKNNYDANDTSGGWTTKSLYNYIGYSDNEGISTA
jgi:hypothetical protein